MTGKLITFEGPEGGGKSTQARLLTEFLRNKNIRVLTSREPGGTPTGEIIRDILRIVFTSGDEVPILYGGSVKPANAADILALDNVNGLLVGGASLEAKSFLDIVRAGL